MNFTVKSSSNPVPYKRTTQKAKWTDTEYKKYQEWKSKIMRDFITAFKKFPHQIFKPKTKYYVEIIVYYKDKTHGDTDNVYKGVLDAIFVKPLNDKYIAGSMDYFYDTKNPRVEIKFLEED
jgi:Holliday junction resolvase RusA-like endonuclease